eukprot:scaffold51611_cov59-Phaeocystis_antarctica.AAC.3
MRSRLRPRDPRRMPLQSPGGSVWVAGARRSTRGAQAAATVLRVFSNADTWYSSCAFYDGELRGCGHRRPERSAELCGAVRQRGSTLRACARHAPRRAPPPRGGGRWGRSAVWID